MSSIKSLLEATGETKTTSSSSSQAKKKVTIPKDPHAPKKPLTAYNIYAAEQRVKMKKEHPDRSFGDMNREIGSLWSTLEQDEKQPYIDKAETEREKHMKDVEEYQKSDKYKKYLQTIAALQQRQQQKKDEKEKSKQQKLSVASKPTKESSPSPSHTDLPPPSRPPPLSLKQSFIPGTEIPIFTNQFLLHNRELEAQVRKLRQATMDMEEENALLSRHVDNMRAQINRLEGDIQSQMLKKQTLKQRLVFLQESLTSAFEDVSIPGIDSVPSVDTIETYLKEIEGVIARQSNDENSDVVSMVRRVCKELIERERTEEKTES